MTTRHSGDGWCQFASALLSARDLENIHCGVVEWGENVGGSSRSGRVVTTRHSGDGWCRFVSVHLFARDLKVCTFHVVEFVIGSKLTGVSSDA